MIRSMSYPIRLMKANTDKNDKNATEQLQQFQDEKTGLGKAYSETQTDPKQAKHQNSESIRINKSKTQKVQ